MKYWLTRLFEKLLSLFSFPKKDVKVTVNTSQYTFGSLLYENALRLKYPHFSAIFYFYYQMFTGDHYQQIIGCTSKEINQIKKHRGSKPCPDFMLNI